MTHSKSALIIFCSTPDTFSASLFASLLVLCSNGKAALHATQTELVEYQTASKALTEQMAGAKARLSSAISDGKTKAGNMEAALTLLKERRHEMELIVKKGHGALATETGAQKQLEKEIVGVKVKVSALKDSIKKEDEVR